MDISFGMLLFLALIPVVVGVIATQVDEDIAMHGGFHKKHL
jgi:hypothetical protein